MSDQPVLGRPVTSGMGAPFWRLFTSSSASNLSDGVLLAALPLLAATLTRNPVAISALSALQFLPWLLFAIPAGTLVDRVNRRTAMASANLVRAALLSVLALVVLGGHASLPLLYVVAFALGCAETVYDNAARAMLPAVVPRSGLERGNSLLSTAESVGNIFLGAPAGAWLFAVAVSLPLWVGGGTYLVAALLALAVAGSFRPVRTTTTSVREDMVEGLRWLAGNRLLRTLMVTTAFSALIYSMVQGILVLFALQNLGLSERGFGLMLAVGGAGAVVGSLLSPYVTRVLGRPEAMGASMFLSSVVLLVMAAWQQPVVGMLCFGIDAAAVSMFNVQIMSVRQALIPEELFGRVQGAYRTVIWGGIPIGTLVGGILGSWLGLTAVFVVSGVVGTAVGVLTWLALRRHRDEIAAGFDPDR